jgi:hypothetical protein
VSELIKRIAFLRGLIEDPIGEETGKSDDQKQIDAFEKIAAARLAGDK